MSPIFSWFGKKGSGKTPEQVAEVLTQALDAEVGGDVKAATKFYEEAIAAYQALGLRKEGAAAQLLFAQMLVRDSNFTAAFEAFDTAISQFKSLGLQPELAAALRDCGLASAAYSNFEQAERQLNESLSIFKATGDNAGSCSCVEGLGSSAYHDENYIVAAGYYEEAFSLRTALGMSPEAAACLVYLSSCATALNDYELASQRFSQSIELFNSEFPNMPQLQILADLGKEPFAIKAEAQVTELLNAALTIYTAVGREGSQRLPALSKLNDEKSSVTSTYSPASAATTDPGDWHSQASANLLLGSVAYSQDNSDLANKLFTQSMEMSEENGDGSMLAHVLSLAGSYSQRFENYKMSQSYYGKLAELASENNEATIQATALLNRSVASYYLHDLDLARSDCERSLELFKEARSVAEVALCLQQYGTVLAELGEVQTGVKLINEALELHRKLGNEAEEARAILNLGFAVRKVDVEYAKTCLSQCLESAAATKSLKALAHQYLADLELSKGELAAAYEASCQALAIGIEIQKKEAISRALEVCAHVAVEWGDIETSVILLGRSADMRSRISAPRTEEQQRLFDADVLALHAELGEADFAKAWNEGQTLSLSDVLEEAESLLEEIEPEDDSEIEYVDDADDDGGAVV